MKVVILAGGLGTRISEETHIRPKPMVEIGGMPILWHIMKIYSAHGLNDFIVCLGYKSYFIKEYFSNYLLHKSDVTFDMRTSGVDVHHRDAEPWRVSLIDTGLETQTGGRLKRVAKYIGDDDFCMTYGDGVADVDLTAEIAFHKSHNKLATILAVAPPGRFGALDIDENNAVKGFAEKPSGDGARINGGFFVLSPKVLDYIDGDSDAWEGKPLTQLAAEGEVRAFRHDGFWQPMDTLRDRNTLDGLLARDEAPWKTWS
ncbi:glucose-1-phosphate cytidylyltransferase [Sulfitobacter sp. SK012]|uniref:glucose-1-phosphate cytidylyltransferase n=1 Tax=Sulfitobacter sp. SK012 TaxID=1389005 RepID=UPI000E0C0E61|nr:glucose-1-phosphate cytidylyltransferase [Sulfitobacter sp. SK012]AXI48169.1 glucose-1-phosphate cytidylyltransferase [Sulfitobacter sp. SK012]